MKRRRFAVVSGSTILTSSVLGYSNQPSVALEFDGSVNNTGSGGRHGTQNSFKPTLGVDGIVFVRIRPK